jgi:uncharacterized protein
MITISEQESTMLVRLARQEIARAVLGSSDTEEVDSACVDTITQSGIFVTVFVDGLLRGCIGDLDPTATASGALAHAARSAVLFDHRFDRIAKADLPRLEFDITVLEPRIPITSELDVVIGRDGVYIEYLASRGLLLPQVATERQWTARQFLDAVCDKAGLHRGAWRDSTARCFRFGALKIHATFLPDISGSEEP